jgi:hypothetical protein
MSTNQPIPPPTDGPHPAAPPAAGEVRPDAPLYLKVFTPAFLRWMSLISFAVAVGMLLYWSFNPDRLGGQIPRAVAGLLIGTLFAVFFFVFYPDNLEIQLPSVLGTAVRVTGPLVLFVVVTWLVIYFLEPAKEQTAKEQAAAPPLPATWVRFAVLKDGQRNRFLSLTSRGKTHLYRNDGQDMPEYCLVGDQESQTWVEAIYVWFPENVSEIPVVLHHDGWVADVQLPLKRDRATIDIAQARNKSQPP